MNIEHQRSGVLPCHAEEPPEHIGNVRGEIHLIVPNDNIPHFHVTDASCLPAMPAGLSTGELPKDWIPSLASRDSGVVDPVLEVDPGNAPFPPELDRRKFSGTQHTRHDEARYIHVLADVGDRKPLFGDVHFDALHLTTAYAGRVRTASAHEVAKTSPLSTSPNYVNFYKLSLCFNRLIMMDPLRHPDLVDVSRRLRRQWERVAEAEQAAARALWWRRRSLRDRLIDAEDRNECATLWCGDGRAVLGVVQAVGSDHVVLRVGDRQRFVLLHQIVAAGFEGVE